MARPGRPKGSNADTVILKGAAIAFSRLGYARCRIEDILQVAEASRTNFYRHFANKDDVYRQLVTRELRYARTSLEHVIATLPEGLDVEEKLRRVIARDVEIALEAGPFLRTMYAETGTLEGYEELWAEKNRYFRALISDLLEGTGLPRPDPLLLEAVLTGIEHVLVALNELPGAEPVRQARGEMLIRQLFTPLTSGAGINIPSAPHSG